MLFQQYIVENLTNFINIYFFLIPILVFVTVLTIYLSNLVELFILCCSGASLLSFCTFIQFLFTILIIIIIISITTPLRLNYCCIIMMPLHTLIGFNVKYVP